MIKEWLRWFDENVSHLEVAVLDYLGFLIMIALIIYDGNILYWIIGILNLFFALLNHYYSWKEDEFNRRKYRNIN